MSRFRERSTDSYLPVAHESNFSAAANKSSNDNYPQREEMTDDVSPDYFKKLKSGKLLPLNSMTSRKKRFSSDHAIVKWERVRKSDGHYRSSEWFGNLAMSSLWKHHSSSNPSSPGGSPWIVWKESVVKPDWPSEADTITSGLADARSKGMDLLTFSSELHKTIRMITNFRNDVLKRAQRVSSHVGRRRNKAPASEAARAFSETWLEARYGWRILAYDIQDINLKLLKLRSLASKIVRGYATNESSLERTVFAVSSPVPLGHWRYGQSISADADVSTAVHTCVQMCTRQIRSGSLIDSVAEGLVFADPINTLWEITPYSFIVDWFSNIGESLLAFSPTAVGRLRGSWVSAKETIRTEVSMTPVYYDHPTWTFTPSSTATVSVVSEDITYDRYPVNPSFNLSLRLNIDAAKITDLVSIFFVRHHKLMRELTKTARI